MNTKINSLIPSRAGAALTILLLLILGYLIHRSHGLNPAVFADEWYYSKFSHLTPLAESILPSYLYLWIMGGTTACGTSFLDCARILNVAAVVAAAPFIYFTASAFASKRVAGWIAILCTLLPMSSYTAFFMPESSYYFGFWVLSWHVLTNAQQDRRVHAALAGMLLGVLSLVKVHAVFLLPALCAYFFFLEMSNSLRRRGVVHAVVAVVLVAGATFITKFGMSYLLVGKAGLSVFGSFYGATAAVKPDRMLLLAMIWENGRGHAMAMALLYAVPLVILVQSLVTALVRRSTDAQALKLHVYTFLMVGSALGMAVLYTASIAVAGAEEALRLHLRYYNFTFPLLLVGAASVLNESRVNQQRTVTWVLAGVAAILIAFAAVKLPQFRLLLIDTPEVSTIANEPWTRYITALAGLVLVAIWVRNGSRGAALFLFVFVPATILVSEVRLRPAMHELTDESYFDTAGKFVRNNIPAAERAQLTVVGSNVAQLMRTLFIIDTDGADYIEVPYRSSISKEQLPKGRKWILVVDTHALPSDLPVTTRTEQYVLIEGGLDSSHAARTAFMNTLHPSGLIARMTGLSGMETNGKWSDAKQVVFEMAQPLPKELTVVLRAAAFGPNVDVPVTMHVGDAVASATFGPALANRTYVFKTDGKQKTLTIDIPQPISPKSLGQSDDPRTLGIMVNSLTFTNNE